MNKLSHKDALPGLLPDHAAHHMQACQRYGGFRYGARIMELRREGRTIETIRISDGEFAYRLPRPVVHEPATQGVLV